MEIVALPSGWDPENGSHHGTLPKFRDAIQLRHAEKRLSSPFAGNGSDDETRAGQYPEYECELARPLGPPPAPPARGQDCREIIQLGRRAIERGRGVIRDVQFAVEEHASQPRLPLQAIAFTAASVCSLPHFPFSIRSTNGSPHCSGG
jgi:hypothetical protein